MPQRNVRHTDCAPGKSNWKEGSMNPFSPGDSQHAGSSRRTRGVQVLYSAGFVLALAACAHDGLDDVKPTATTAYHSGQPDTVQPPAVPQR